MLFLGVDEAGITSGNSETESVSVGGFICGKRARFLALLANASQDDERTTENKGERNEDNEGNEEVVYGAVRVMVGIGIVATVDEGHGRHIVT